MVEVEVYGIVPPPGGDYGGYIRWENERGKAERDLTYGGYGEKGFTLITRRVNVPFHSTGTSRELAKRIAQFQGHPEWTEDQAFREPAFVRGSVYGQLAQSLLQFGKGGKYSANTHTEFAHFTFNDRDRTTYVARLNEQGQFYLKKEREHRDPWRKRAPSKPVSVRGYEVGDSSDSSVRQD